MNRDLMYNADRRSLQFIDGIHDFINVVEANKKWDFISIFPQGWRKWEHDRNLKKHDENPLLVLG